MNCNNSQTKEQLRAKGIEQAWQRRCLYQIHSGVRVRIQRKNPLSIESEQSQMHRELQSTSFDRTNRVQSMLKRLWLESETSALSENGRKSLETVSKSYSIFEKSSTQKNHLLPIDQRDKFVNSIAVQTTIIKQIDRQISCQLIPSISEFIEKNRSLSSSSVSSSETSTSNEHSIDTGSASTVSSSNTASHESDSHNRWNTNQNNNAIDTDIERLNIKDLNKRKSMMDNTQRLENIHCQSISRKKRFFDPIFHLISFLRFSSSKRNIPITITRNEMLRSPTSRCRRSATRNTNHHHHHSSIESEDHPLPKGHSLEEKISIHSLSEKSLTTKNPNRPDSSKKLSKCNHSSVSIVHAHRSRKKRKTTTRRKHKHKKNLSNRYLHRNHIHSSKLKTRSNSLIAKTVQSSLYPTEYSNDTNHTEVQQNSLVLSTLENKTLDLQNQSLPLQTHSIRLCVQNKNLLSTLSKIPSYHVNQSIQFHQKNLINEFQSILQQTQTLHIHNNNDINLT